MPLKVDNIDSTAFVASRRKRRLTALALLCVVTAPFCLAAGSHAATEIAVAVADFDYSDSSGEVTDQTQEHRARVASFAELLREDIAAGGAYRVVQLDCPEHPCTAGTMPPDDFVAAARRAGARLVVYGGIHKMSTLVQWGKVLLLDLQRNEVVLQRTVTFRGDNDTAFRRAAAFVGETLKDGMPKP
jgi:hypothetical protein